MDLDETREPFYTLYQTFPFPLESPIAKLIEQNFEVDVDQDSLRKYLNPEDDKHQENKNSFDKAKSYIPNIIEVS